MSSRICKAGLLLTAPASALTGSVSWSIMVPAVNSSMCRQIFVLERTSDDAAAGPLDRGAAMVMGHSVKQSRDWYDLKFHCRLAQNAVDSMQGWRHCLLDAQPVQQISSAKPRRRARIVYTDSESGTGPVQQPASAAISAVKLNASAESAQKSSATASQRQKLCLPDEW